MASAAGWWRWHSTTICRAVCDLAAGGDPGAGLFGAAWAIIPAYLQAYRGSHIVITTIMFNYIGAALMVYLLVHVLIAPGKMAPEHGHSLKAGSCRNSAGL